MSLSAKYLPRATPLDPAEDPPGSIDPLGTLGSAEHIAEVLFTDGSTRKMFYCSRLDCDNWCYTKSEESAGVESGDQAA